MGRRLDCVLFLKWRCDTLRRKVRAIERDTMLRKENGFMLYVAMLTIVDEEVNAKARPAHLEYLDELHKQGKVVMAGPFTDKKGGMVIYKAGSYEEAKKLAEADPVVAKKARTLELREWNALPFPLSDEIERGGS